MVAWELGSRRSLTFRSSAKQLAINDGEENQGEEECGEKSVSRNAAPVALLIYFAVLGLFVKWFFGLLTNLSIYIAANTNNKQIADAFVSQLKQTTQFIVPWLGILLAVVVMVALFRERGDEVRSEERRGLAKWVDPEKQPLLDTIVTMPWQHLFLVLWLPGLYL